MRSTNESITDKARGLFEKATGKKVPESKRISHLLFVPNMTDQTLLSEVSN